jgi:hypothetical protein
MILRAFRETEGFLIFLKFIWLLYILLILKWCADSVSSEGHTEVRMSKEDFKYMTFTWFYTSRSFLVASTIWSMTEDFSTPNSFIQFTETL